MKDDRKRKRNVLIVNSSLCLGGAEMVISNLCRHIRRDLFDVHVCHLKERGSIGEELSRLGINMIGISGEASRRPDYFSFLKLRRIIRRFRIDIVHSHNTYSLIDSSLCRLTVPGIKSVHTFHFGNYPHLARRYRMAERAFWRVPDRLVSVGHEQKKTLLDAYSIPNHRVATIWNGIERIREDPDMDTVRRFRNEDRIIVGTIGNLIEQKGYAYLLEVASSVRKRRSDVTFLVIGSGPLRGELEEKSRSMGLEDTVHFLGPITNAASRLLPVFDIFFLPSLWEAMSIVVLEAMSAGKPILATRVGENAHLIEDGGTGMLVEPRDVAGMTGKLEILIGSHGLRERLGKAGREKIERTCTAESMSRQYEQLYQSLFSDTR